MTPWLCACCASLPPVSLTPCLPPLPQSVAMLRNMISFYHMANEAVERTAAGGADGQRITYNVIKNRLGDVLYKLRWGPLLAAAASNSTPENFCKSISQGRLHRLGDVLDKLQLAARDLDPPGP